MEKTIKMSTLCVINYQITSTSTDLACLNNVLSRSLYLMKLQVKMIKFACLEKSREKSTSSGLVAVN